MHDSFAGLGAASVTGWIREEHAMDKLIARANVDYFLDLINGIDLDSRRKTVIIEQLHAELDELSRHPDQFPFAKRLRNDFRMTRYKDSGGSAMSHPMIEDFDICMVMALNDVEPCVDCVGTEWSAKTICLQGMKGFFLNEATVPTLRGDRSPPGR
jgi:hypothetical protein